MSREIKIHVADCVYETRSFAFPGGELQVSIPELPEKLAGDITVIARLQSSDAIVRLLLTADILCRHHRAGRKRLVIPYFPFARQDRVMQPREAFSLKAIARIVNGLGFDEVIVCDPHSDVTAALVDKVRVIPQIELVRGHLAVQSLVREAAPIVISPDAGAAKKAFVVAQAFGLSFLTASKVRDTATGAILRTEMHVAGSLAEAAVLIVDDICDGGRTFIELAKVLRQHGAGRVFLYVTHGIFSQGLGVFRSLIDGVFTTNSFLPEHVPDEQAVPVHVSTLDLANLTCP